MPTFDSGSIAVGFPVSGDYRIAALQAEFIAGAPQVWLSTVLTYSFPAGGSRFDGGLNYGEGEIRAGWLPLGTAQQAAVRQALTAWSAVADITFLEVPDSATVGDLRFGFTSAITGTTLGWAHMPVTDDAAAGDVWINATLSSQRFAPSVRPYGSYDSQSAQNFQILLHEIGHALGLSHPFAKAGETRGTAALPGEQDHYNNTVMSYDAYSQHGGIPSTPMPYDVLALQYLYGVNTSHNSGNTTYTYDINDINLLTIWDAGGEDTLSVTNSSNTTGFNGRPQGVTIDLREGAGSKIGFSSQYWASYYSTSLGYAYRNTQPNVFVAYNCTIENAVTTNGDDTITGNAARNVFTSGSGMDVIDGGGGVDTSVYSLARASYTVAKTSTGWTVRDNFTTQGAQVAYTFTDTLSAIERVRFSDVSLALDLSGIAGIVAKVLGAVYGASAVANRAYVGIGLALLDAGMGYQALMQTALDARLGAGYSHTALVNLLHENLLNRAATAQELGTYVGLLDSGAYTAASLGVLAADTPINAANIDLAGLATRGLEYV